MKLARIKQIRRPKQTILAVDSWDITSYESQLEEVEDLGILLEKCLWKLPTAYGLFLDLFAVLFAGDPKMRSNPVPGLDINRSIIQTIWALPELQRLRGRCQYRRTEVTLCILRFGEAILDALPPDMPQLAQKLQQEAQGEGDQGDESQDGQSQAGEGDESDQGEMGAMGSSDSETEQPDSGGDGEGDQGRAGEGDSGAGESAEGAGEETRTGSGSSSEAQQAVDKALRRLKPKLQKILRDAVNDAQQEVKDLQSVCDSQGWDLSEGQVCTESGLAAWEACKKLMQSNALREVFRTFGNKLRTLAMASQEQKPVGKGFVAIDRTVGEELEHIPLDETWILADPALAVLAAQAIAEGTLVQEDFQEEFEREQGDIVALMDTSGSTSGDVSQFIKGAILGLQSVAQGQGRKLLVIPFADSPHAVRDLTTPTPQQLLSLAEIRSNGGTDFGEALKAAVQAVKEIGNPDYPPDIVMFTDGQCGIPAGYYYDTAECQKYRDDLKRDIEALGGKLKVVYVGIRKDHLNYKDIGQLAGPGNEIFLGSVDDWAKLGQVYEQM